MHKCNYTDYYDTSLFDNNKFIPYLFYLLEVHHLEMPAKSMPVLQFQTW